jgi:hypothetical protein
MKLATAGMLEHITGQFGGDQRHTSGFGRIEAMLLGSRCAVRRAWPIWLLSSISSTWVSDPAIFMSIG